MFVFLEHYKIQNMNIFVYIPTTTWVEFKLVYVPEWTNNIKAVNISTLTGTSKNIPLGGIVGNTFYPL